MKQFRYTTTERGIQVHKTLCADTKKQACKLLDINSYTMNKYCYAFEPRDFDCINSPNEIFAYIDSGEAVYAFPNFRNKIIKWDDLKNMINAHRKKFHSYRETQEFAETGKIPEHTIDFKNIPK